MLRKKYLVSLVCLLLFFIVPKLTHAALFISQTREEFDSSSPSQTQYLYLPPSSNTSPITSIKLKLKYNGGCPDGVYASLALNGGDSVSTFPVYLPDYTEFTVVEFPVPSYYILPANQLNRFQIVAYTTGRPCDNGSFLTFRTAQRLDDATYNSSDPNQVLWFEIYDASLDSSPVKNPVLIVPGVLGSEIKNDKGSLWADLSRMTNPLNDDSFMDPLGFKSDLSSNDGSVYSTNILRKIGPPGLEYNYAEGLIEELKNQGYTENQDLFTFPYDWRYGVTGRLPDGTTNADKLKAKVAEIKSQTGALKVDVVAHSTGGLLVKKYVVDNQNSHFIDKAVLVGVPALGAPKATKVLFQGDSFGVTGLDPLEMKNIGRNMPVVYDLAPSKQYYDIKGSWVKNISTFNRQSQITNLGYGETKVMLNTDGVLNTTAWNNAENLHTQAFDYFDMRNAGVDTYNIVGCKTSTPGVVVRQQRDENGSSLVYFTDPEMVVGDATVPFESANATLADDSKTFYIQKADHGKMLSLNGSRQQIVNIIAGSSLPTPNVLAKHDLRSNPAACELKGKKIIFHSPVNVQVIDQDGNKTGVLPDGTVENNIPGASLEVIDGHKYLYVPEGDGEHYTISFVGTGVGTFTLQVVAIDNSHITQTTSFVDVPVTTALKGIIDVAHTVSVSVDNNGDGNTDKMLSPDTIAAGPLDILPPQTAAAIVGTSGQPSFYRSNVAVTLNAADAAQTGAIVAGVLKVEYDLDGTGKHTYASPLNITTEGKHSITFYGTDKLGNREDTQTVEFTIDKAGPELTMSFNLSAKDLVFTAVDALDTSPVLLDSGNVVTATDKAGNTTQLGLNEKDRKKKMKIELISFSYNGIMQDLTKNKLVYAWDFDRNGILKQLDQKVVSKKDYTVQGTYKNNVTVFEGKDTTGKFRMVLPGVKVLQVKTNKGSLEWAVQ